MIDYKVSLTKCLEKMEYLVNKSNPDLLRIIYNVNRFKNESDWNRVEFEINEASIYVSNYENLLIDRGLDTDLLKRYIRIMDFHVGIIIHEIMNGD